MQQTNLSYWLRVQHEYLFVEFGAIPRLGDVVIVMSQDSQPMQAEVYTGDHYSQIILGRVVAQGSPL